MSSWTEHCSYCGGYMYTNHHSAHTGIFYIRNRYPQFCDESCRELSEREIPLPKNYEPRGLFTKGHFVQTITHIHGPDTERERRIGEQTYRPYRRPRGRRIG